MAYSLSAPCVSPSRARGRILNWHDGPVQIGKSGAAVRVMALRLTLARVRQGVIPSVLTIASGWPKCTVRRGAYVPLVSASIRPRPAEYSRSRAIARSSGPERSRRGVTHTGITGRLQELWLNL